MELSFLEKQNALWEAKRQKIRNAIKSDMHNGVDLEKLVTYLMEMEPQVMVESLGNFDESIPLNVGKKIHKR